MTEPGAVKSYCTSGCGRALMAKCVPMMKNFSQNQKEIDTLSAKLVKVEQIEDAQKDYMEKKEKLRELSKSI